MNKTAVEMVVVQVLSKIAGFKSQLANASAKAVARSEAANKPTSGITKDDIRFSASMVPAGVTLARTVAGGGLGGIGGLLYSVLKGKDYAKNIATGMLGGGGLGLGYGLYDYGDIKDKINARAEAVIKERGL